MLCLTPDRTEGFWWLAPRFPSAAKPFITVIIRIGASVDMPDQKVLLDSVKGVYDVDRNGLTDQLGAGSVHLRKTNVGGYGRSCPSETLFV